MKRVNENIENSVLKKVKFFNVSDENFIDLDKNEGEEENVLAENGGVDSAQIDGSFCPLGDEAPDNFDIQCLGGAEGSNKWDFDINFDMIFGNEEEQKGSDIDLNLPEYCTYRNMNKRKSLWESDKYPIRKGKGFWDEEVVDLVSHDSDSDVEVIGYTHGYSSKDKQIESVMPGDGEEDLNLGLGLLCRAIVSDQSNLVTGGDWSYIREEKGKATDTDSWLTFKANNVVDLEVDIDEPIQSIEPPENVEVVPRWRSNEIVIRAAVTDSDYRRKFARKLARTTLSDQDNGNQSSSQKQQPSTPNTTEKLANLPGPFSETLKMIRERTSKVAAEKLIQWRPLMKNQEERITADFVPSLLDLSLKALAKSAEGLVSLGQVPDFLRGRLTNILCDIGGMNTSFLSLLMEGCPTEIHIKNCSWLTDEQFQKTIGKCQTKDLRVLQLDLCGKCMLDIGFKNILDRCWSSFSRLAIVSLRGACRLSDNGLKLLVQSAPLVQSINLGQCTLITSDAIKHIADVLGSNLRELYIDECQKIDALQSLPALKNFKHLEVLSVAGIHSINDWFVSEIVTAYGQSLRELDFADCFQLTDCSLKAIGESCAGLSSLNISNLNHLTDLGMEYLANGCRSIKNLKLRRNEFSDEAVAAFLECSGESLLELLLNNIAKVGPLTALALAKHSRKLLSLDVSWCRRISNEALGLIVDCCLSLKMLKIFGCRQITNVFLEGHSNGRVRIIGSAFTPILEHLDLFEPEERLLRYSPLASDVQLQYPSS